MNLMQPVLPKGSTCFMICSVLSIVQVAYLLLLALHHKSGSRNLNSVILAKNHALHDLAESALSKLALQEELAEELVLNHLDRGSMVLVGNPRHAGLEPMLIGQPARVKINANIGTSPLCNCSETEKRKNRSRSSRRSGHDHGSFDSR